MKRRAGRLVGFLVFLPLIGALTTCAIGMVLMPGTSFKGAAGALNADDTTLAKQLGDDIDHLAVTIGERNVRQQPAALATTATWLETRLTTLGYVVERHTYEASTYRAEEAEVLAAFSPPHAVSNLIVERRGGERADEIVVVGAHYDSAEGTPGADDNGSGVAVGLALAEAFATKTTARTMRFVFFVNEEPPWFEGPHMGSEMYAQRCKDRGEQIVAMIALETMGYFNDGPDTQHYPAPLSAVYPSTGSFIGFVGDTAAEPLVHDTIQAFRTVASVASEGAALPASLPGVDWSDHGPFSRRGYRSLMVTDTAPFRNPHYHQASDTPGTLDVPRLTRVTRGLVVAVEHIAMSDRRW